MALPSAPAVAQLAWTNSGVAGFWTNSTIWTPASGFPNGVDSTAFFNATLLGTRTITNTVAITNGTVRFTTPGSYGFIIVSSATSRIYFQGSGSALIDVTTSSAAQNFFNTPLTLLSALVVSNSGNLFLAGVVSNSGNTLTIAGSGNTYLQQALVDSGGLVKTGSGVAVLTGTNAYSGGTWVSEGSLRGNTAGIQGGITNDATVIFNNTAGGTYGGAMSGSGSLTISNNSGIVILLTNQNTYAGGTLVQQGGLSLSNSLGMIGNTASLTLLAGTTLQLDNRGVSNFNRMAGVPLTMQGATLLVLGGGTNNLGSITFGTGGSVISNVASFISGGAFSRGAGYGTVNFTGSGTNLFSTPAGSSNAILPWAFIKGADFATHDGNGTALRAFSNYSAAFAADANVKATAVNSVGGMAINSLVLGTNLTIAAGQTLTNTSGGMILTLANQLITNGSLFFSAEGIVENEAAATISSTLVTPSGLTKTGAGALTLLGTNQTAGGTLRVNQGSLAVGEGGVVDGGDVFVNAGTFNMNGGAASLNSLVVTGTSANLTLGYGTLTTTNGFLVNNSASILVGGVSGKTMTWSMLGGTNVTGPAGSLLSLTVGGAVNSFNTGVVVVAGPSTVWSNGMGLWVGGNLTVTTHTNSLGQVFISNGATVYLTSGPIANNSAGLAVGGYTAGSSLTLADGGKLYYTGANAVRMGANPSSSNNTILVTGAGSVLDTGTNRPINIGYSGSVGGGNLLTVSSGGKVVTAGLAIGGQFNASGTGTGNDPGAGSNNTVVVQDPGTVWSNGNSASSVFIGFSGAGNSLVVSNQAVFSSMGAITLALTAGGTSNQLLVLDGGRVTAASVTIGNGSGARGNTLTVSNGAKVYSGAATIGGNVSALNNSVILSGGIWTNSALSMLGQSNSLTILAGSLFQSAGTSYISASGNSATMSSNLAVTVAGSGAVWTNLGTLNIGRYASYASRVLVTNGGLLYSTAPISIGAANTNSNNGLVISDSGSTASMDGVRLDVGGGAMGDGNLLAVSNGASLSASSVAVGSGVRNTNNLFLVTGPGSVARLGVGLSIGTNSGSWGIGGTGLNGDGSARVAEGGLLELNVLHTGYSPSSTFSNVGSVLQFATNTPEVSVRVAGTIVVTNGTIAFRGVDGVNVKANWGVGALGRSLTNIAFRGENTFRLNSASTTNGGQDYVFDTGRGATNYTRLEMINGSTLWQGGSLTLGAGGTMLVSNTSATVAGATTNSGTITVMNSRVTYAAPVVISGLYSSDPSTNTFVTNLTVTASGALQGSNGDLFVFGGHVLNQSTNRSSFSLWQAAVLFTNLAAGGTNHTYDVSGSGSVDYGTGFTNFDRVSTNFAIGTLSIAAGNRLTLTGSVSAVDLQTNALYVGWLDIQGLTFTSTNTQENVFNTLTAALDLPNINLYYSREDPRNQWLNEFIPDTGYDLWGGGMLLPIPEPSPLLAVGAGLAVLAFLRRRKGA